MANIPIVILIIIGINIAFSYQGFNNSSFFNKYKFHIGSIHNGEKLRMLSSAFLHGDWMHLMFNMYSLYIFSPIVLLYFNYIDFIVLYIGSLLIGNIVSFYFHKKEYHYAAIGASGAVSGVVYSAVMLEPMREFQFIFFPFLDIPGYILGSAFMLYSIYAMRNNRDNIGHDAHFGGAAGGYVITLLINPNLLLNNGLITLLLALPIILLYFLVKSGKFNR